MATFEEEAIDRLVGEAQRPAAEMDELYQQVLAVTGVARDQAKLVTVECSAQGVTGLDIDPRAMRWGSQRLSETILTLIAEALADMQAKSAELLRDVLGEGPLDLAAEANPADLRMREAREAYEAAMDQATAELARIQRDLGP
ncbi:YbaB/EbfC family DNA-binding protein [Nonomuraea mesophila]|uniref:YbaB/EbfC family DNA-binding protein n=1 Tax=Nonomuraea mesophila TaxID=2530382 RepID=A0A4R5FFN4_9ACTN|nr:YbaB/EbfC family nucleoid-associated protein [Nonomuraea mesophila]TDE49730.1 YbaB/EbfC family DNA-binding protein [Nonomuraea mesophila]